MKQLVFSVVIAFAGSAFAQAPKEPAKPAVAAQPASQEAKPVATKEAAASPRKMPNPRRWNEDARHCLEKGNSTEIIKCAEEFL